MIDVDNPVHGPAMLPVPGRKVAECVIIHLLFKYRYRKLTNERISCGEGFPAGVLRPK
jgi:hypothetical protein